MTEQKPSVCRMVQFNDDPYLSAQDPDGPDPDCWIAALVVCVHGDEVVDIVTWDQFGNESFKKAVDLGTDRYQWRWPPRV